MQFRTGQVSAMSLEEILRPTQVGDSVVHHVYEAAKEPAPDFEAMKRLYSSPQSPKDPGRGEEKEGG